MSGFELSNNYTDNLEALLRKNRSCTTSSATPSAVEPVTPVPSATTKMAKSLRDYSNPVVANMPVGPAVNTGTGNFELCTGLIMIALRNANKYTTMSMCVSVSQSFYQRINHSTCPATRSK